MNAHSQCSRDYSRSSAIPEQRQNAVKEMMAESRTQEHEMTSSIRPPSWEREGATVQEDSLM